MVSYLRPASGDNAHHVGAVLRKLVAAIRQYWPHTKITFRADSGLCRKATLHWCEKNGVDYLLGIPSNLVLQKMNQENALAAELWSIATQRSQRNYGEFFYQAGSWKSKRRIISRNECTEKGLSVRFIVTNKQEASHRLYEAYCGRGEIENRIKEQQLWLFADRTSCQKWWPNQLRLCFSSIAYLLVERFRSLGLKGTKFCRAQVDTIRRKFLKIATCFQSNTRKKYFWLQKNYPNKNIFYQKYTKMINQT